MNIWFLLFMCVLLCCCLQMDIFRTASLQMEDALAASNLAAAVIDTEEYGRTHNIIIPADRAYALFQSALKGNLSLDDSWESPSKQWMSGPVCIVEFIVYNVTGDTVTATVFLPDGRSTSRECDAETAWAPNGRKVETSGIYSEIAFDVEGLFGMTHRAQKSKLVDVVSNGNEEGY